MGLVALEGMPKFNIIHSVVGGLCVPGFDPSLPTQLAICGVVCGVVCGVQATLRAELGGKTTLAIAHRLHSVIDYDAILVLDHGQVRGAAGQAVGGACSGMPLQHNTARAT